MQFGGHGTASGHPSFEGGGQAPRNVVWPENRRVLRKPSDGNPAITYRPNRHVNIRVRNRAARQRTNRSLVPGREDTTSDAPPDF